MIVDDESGILYVLRPGVEKNRGYSVCTFSVPVQALKHFRDNPGAYDLVISDVRMSEMTGFEFVRHVKEIRPDIKVMLMTAFDINQSEFARVLPST
jgi:DNA-binding NtrC family response regulator